MICFCRIDNGCQSCLPHLKAHVAYTPNKASFLWISCCIAMCHSINKTEYNRIQAIFEFMENIYTATKMKSSWNGHLIDLKQVILQLSKCRRVESFFFPNCCFRAISKLWPLQLVYLPLLFLMLKSTPYGSLINKSDPSSSPSSYW